MLLQSAEVRPSALSTAVSAPHNREYQPWVEKGALLFFLVLTAVWRAPEENGQIFLMRIPKPMPSLRFICFPTDHTHMQMK